MSFESEMDEALGVTKMTARHLMRGHWGDVKSSDVLQTARHTPLLVRQTLRYALQHRAYNPPGAEVRLRVHCEQRPDGESSITLGDERDSLGLLRARLDWRISKLELRTIRYFAETATEALADIADVKPDKALLSDDGSFVERCDDSNHHMGGMRMAASPGDGIVTPDLLLHGVRNAYVCSGAVFPTSGFSNPTHTVIALAMRLADRLAKL
jgi:choline dehydrogenase-like flavoprotein